MASGTLPFHDMQVCNDPNLMSNDPLEAVLLDGAFIVDWASKRVRAIEEGLQSSLRSEAAFQQYATTQLQQELSRVNVLSAVLHALWRIRGTGNAAAAAAGDALTKPGTSTGGQQGATGIQAELGEVVLVQQALQIASWCVRQGLHTASPTGRYASVQEWMRAVQARRDRRPTHQPLFLDDILRVRTGTWRLNMIVVIGMVALAGRVPRLSFQLCTCCMLSWRLPC